MSNLDVRRRSQRIALGLLAGVSSLGLFVACGKDNDNGEPDRTIQLEKSRANGQRVFRMETFGNEGFWTDAARLPAGIVAAKLTPVQALKTGLSVNVDALDPATQKAVADEIAKDGTAGPILNDFETTVKLLNANAVIGVVVRDSNGDGIFDIRKGDKVGVSCAMCHAVTDHSVFDTKTGGSIGKQVDGPAVHNINVGAILALADNSRAFFPMAQLKNAEGKSVGRAPSKAGLTKDSNEAAFDAYFGNPDFYPVGMFDDTVDGNGNPVHNTPMFRADLSAPFGSGGELTQVDHFSNTVFTVLFDMTNLTTPGGRAFLETAAGAGGVALANDYKYVLDQTGVTGYPYVKATTEGMPGDGRTLIGLRVDDAALLDMTAYLQSLRSPAGVIDDQAAVDRGRNVFLNANNKCTACHGANQSRAVPANIVPMLAIFPGDSPVLLGNRGDKAESPIIDSPAQTFDDKMIIINASLRGLVRGSALPLLMDLNRKPVFLHDNSVPSLEKLFDRARGPSVPHPFYVDGADRADLIQFLKSLDDTDVTAL